MSLSQRAAGLLARAEGELPPEPYTITLDGATVTVALRPAKQSLLEQLPGADTATRVYVARLLSPRRRPGSLTAGARGPWAIDGLAGEFVMQPYHDPRHGAVKNAIGEDLILFWHATL